MNSKIIKTNLVAPAVGPYSQAIKTGNLLFVSGQIPLDSSGKMVDGNVTLQTKQVMSNLKAIIEEAGMNLTNVVKCSCFLKSMNDFAEFNAVYSEWFGSVLPARECVEVARLPKDVLVEVSAICVG